MHLNIIKNFIKTFKSKKKKRRNKLLLNKIEQTFFIKKRQKITFSKVNFRKLFFIWKNTTYTYTSIAFLFFVLIFIFLFWTSFNIKYIEIIKQDSITNMSIAYKSTDKYRLHSVFNLKEKEILKRLQDYQQNIKNINIKIKLPNTLKIQISSYPWIFNTLINNKHFIITQNWTLVPSNYSEELKELILIKDFDPNIFIDYKKILDQNFLKQITLIITSLKENIIDLKISEIKYYITERELHIKNDKNVVLIFDINSNTKEQIEKIAIFNKEQININKYWLIYIDLRIKNKVFYCTTENEYQCYKNLKSIYLK